MDKHNRHHAHPNTEDTDPDIDAGAFAFTHAQARARPARPGCCTATRPGFFPLLLFEGIALHVASVVTLRSRAVRYRPAELGLLAAHVAGDLTAVLLVLSPVKAAVFILVNQGLFGLYLGCSSPPITRECQS